MALTVEEYHLRWQKAMEPGARPGDLPWYEQKITPTACILFEAAVHSAVGGGEGYSILPDFGDATCWYRYMQLHEEFRGKEGLLSPEDLARQETAQRELDALLERYVRKGYQPKMGKEFKAIVERSFREWDLILVYSLPNDLGRLLKDRGNPHALRYEVEEEADVRKVPAFAFDNPAHCRALENSLVL